MSERIRTKVTLKVAADEGDKVIYITEPAAYVRAAAEAGGYVLMTRVRGLRLVDFATQATNIVNIEACDA